MKYRAKSLHPKSCPIQQSCCSSAYYMSLLWTRRSSKDRCNSLTRFRPWVSAVDVHPARSRCNHKLHSGQKSGISRIRFVTPACWRCRATLPNCARIQRARTPRRPGVTAVRCQLQFVAHTPLRFPNLNRIRNEQLTAGQLQTFLSNLRLIGRVVALAQLLRRSDRIPRRRMSSQNAIRFHKLLRRIFRHDGAHRMQLVANSSG